MDIYTLSSFYHIMMNKDVYITLSQFMFKVTFNLYHLALLHIFKLILLFTLIIQNI